MSERPGGDRPILSILRIVVRGRVQGVGYRAWTRHQAELHDIAGWVRNLPDGSVEAVLAGPADRVGLMVRAMREGPRGAVVEAVEEHPAAADEAGAMHGFEVRRTAE